MLERSQIPNSYHYIGEAFVGDVWRHTLLEMCGDIREHSWYSSRIIEYLPLGPTREVFCCILIYHCTTQRAISCDIVTESNRRCQEIY